MDDVISKKHDINCELQLNQHSAPEIWTMAESGEIDLDLLYLRILFQMLMNLFSNVLTPAIKAHHIQIN
jgi:hypothetical protein